MCEVSNAILNLRLLFSFVVHLGEHGLRGGCVVQVSSIGTRWKRGLLRHWVLAEPLMQRHADENVPLPSLSCPLRLMGPRWGFWGVRGAHRIHDSPCSCVYIPFPLYVIIVIPGNLAGLIGCDAWFLVVMLCVYELLGVTWINLLLYVCLSCRGYLS